MLKLFIHFFILFAETSRKYPIAAFLIRKSNSDYTFNGTNITIPKNIGIFLSLAGIHHDPKIYPNPDKFNPYNFTEEAVNSRHPMSFLAFGDGPHNCIGNITFYIMFKFLFVLCLNF